MPLHPLSIIKIIKYFNYKPTFNGVFPRINLAKIIDGAYVIHLNSRKCKGARWVSLIIHRNTAVYFDSLGTEYIPQEV